MSTVVSPLADKPIPAPDKSFSRTIDRWIYVGMAAWFIAIVLVGFVPDSFARLASIDAGGRAPFTPLAHAHAALTGSFLLMLLAQSTLVASGRRALHRRLGVAGAILAGVIFVVGMLLVAEGYRAAWNALHAAPPAAQAQRQMAIFRLDNTMLIQLRIAFVFAIAIAIGLLARKSDPGLHKRLMILGVAITLSAAINRMPFMPSTMPDSPLALDLYIFLAAAPMLAWDIFRTRRVHKAYLIWLAAALPPTLAMHALWNSEWWRETAPRLVGVA
jgi:hypothetical protein